MRLACNETAKAVPTELDATKVRPDPECTLRISNVRFEAPPPDAPWPSKLLKFDMSNDGAVRMTDVSIEVTVRETVSAIDGINEMRLLVGPFTIRGHVTIEAGYTFNYNLLLRNLAPDCQCLAVVNVVSAQPLQ